ARAADGPRARDGEEHQVRIAAAVDLEVEGDRLAVDDEVDPVGGGAGNGVEGDLLAAGDGGRIRDPVVAFERARSVAAAGRGRGEMTGDGDAAGELAVGAAGDGVAGPDETERVAAVGGGGVSRLLSG